MRISDWSSDVCSSDLNRGQRGVERGRIALPIGAAGQGEVERAAFARAFAALVGMAPVKGIVGARVGVDRGEEDGGILVEDVLGPVADRKSTRLNSSH